VLAEGYEFNDGSTGQDLFVPSGAQTGIKLNLHVADEDADDEGALEIVSGETILVLDFDVSRSFVIQGNPLTPAGIHSVLFTPTIRVAALDAAGSIEGTVTTALQNVSVEGLTVTAEPLDEGTLEGYQTSTATTTTDEDGVYTLHFLVPGTYTVTVTTPTGLTTAPVEIEVEVGLGETVEDIDFAVVASS
jgi:hypothetical protein